MSGNHVFIYLRQNLDRNALGVIQRTFTRYEPGEIHYVQMDGTIEDYVNHRAAYNGHGRLVCFFMVYEGQVSSQDETCFRVVFDPEFTPERIQLVSTESGLERIAHAGIVENRTAEELLEQALECPDEILR